MRTKNGEARLEEVRRQFEYWRRTRERRTRIPEPLWTAAVELASMVGIGPTAKALGINPDSLKRQMKAATDSASSGRGRRQASAAGEAATTMAWAPTEPTFLELPPSMWVAGNECTLELEEVGGAKMRVHLKGPAVPDLVALSRTFWTGVS